MRRRQRPSCLALAAVLAVVPATACSPATTPAPQPTVTHTPRAGDPVAVGTLPLPPRFDPTDTDDPSTARIGALLQRGVYRYDAKGKAVLEVAESVETTDNRVYRVRLADGWRFTDGEPVTADSFVDAWSRVADPARPRLRRDLLAPIDGFVASKNLAPAARSSAGSTGSTGSTGHAVPDGGPSASRGGRTTAPAPPTSGLSTGLPTGRSPRLRGLTVLDDRTFTITLTRPHPGFEQRLGNAVFAPLPDAAFTDPDGFARRPIGNGPYQLMGDWSGSGVRLRPNAGYTAGDSAQNPGLDFRSYTDPAAGLRDVAAGRLDVLDVLPTSGLDTYKSTFAERAVNQPIGRVLDLVIPVTIGPWTGSPGTQRRTAISMAIDRDALARDVYAGTRSVPTDLATPVVEGHSRDLCGAVCRMDADTAARTLADAGGLPGGLRIAYATDADEAPVVDAICADVVRNLDIPCTGRPYPTSLRLRAAVASGRESGPYLATRQMDYPQLESFLVPRYVLGALANDTGYADPTTDTALARAAGAPDPTERTRRFQAAEQRILTTLPVIPLLDVHATAVSSTSVRDVRFDVFGTPDYTAIARATGQ